MRVFHCACGRRLFFENDICTGCGRQVGFDATTLQMRTLEGPGPRHADASGEGRWRRCQNGLLHASCNWLLPADADDLLCRACRLNRTIPDLGKPGNATYWAALEAAKRRTLYTFLGLGLDFEQPGPNGEPSLAVEFLEDQSRNPQVVDEQVFTGYGAGVVTINVAEADDVQRELTRTSLNESYRTLLGHVRHESGHFYFERLVAGTRHHARFRELFGDETVDYAAALQAHYARAPEDSWPEHYISAYAQSHPLEDWAESWAHMLHALDTVETARANGLVPSPGAAETFESWLSTWMTLTVTLNELNRSMGVRDAYPFTLTPAVIRKLGFARSVLWSAVPAT